MHIANGIVAPNDRLAAWLAARCGKLTGSRCADAFAMLKNGNWAKSRADLIRDLLAERLTGLNVRHYVNDAMQWGLDTEPEAKAAYEDATGNIVADCGYYDHPTIDNFGATPDGLIGMTGVIEIKCPTTPTFVDWLRAGEVPPKHVMQMLAELACTGRKWVEFVAFDPRIVDPKRRLFIRRFEPKPEAIEQLETMAIEFLEEVDAAWEALTTA